MKIIDTHSHIQEKEFDHSREEILARMRAGGVGTIAIGCDYASSLRAVELALKESNVWACVGMHPVDTQNIFEGPDFIGLISAKKADGTRAVVGVGECGLDYFRLERTGSTYTVEVERQKISFRNQIRFALEHDLPLMLHVRPSHGTTDAHDDALEILKTFLPETESGAEIRGLRGTCHFFTSTIDVAQRYLELGFHISFPGVITFAKELEEVVRAVPLNRILLETDAPYAAPVPYRGKQNEPAYIVEVARKIAEVQGVPLEVVLEHTTQNARAVFGL